jgi:hypothetical protein
VAGGATAASVFALGFALAGCDRGHPDADLDAPPVKLIKAQVGLGIGGDPNPSNYQDLDENAPSSEVGPKWSIRLRFDRFLLPAETFRQSICVQSDPEMKPVKSYKDCTSPVYFETVYDPVSRSIVYWQREDSGQEQMKPGTPYLITVFPKTDVASGGIQAFDGAPLDRTYTFRFTTAEASPTDVADALPTQELFCTSVKDFLGGCAFSNCHFNTTDSKTDQLVGAAAGLDLNNPLRISATAIGHTAHGTQTGEHADDVDRSSPRFGKAMPIIDPGFPGNSYILYKLLSNPTNLAILADRPSDAEVARLRAGVVVGMPMPPADKPPLFTQLPLEPDPAMRQVEEGKYKASIEALSTWIIQGAPTDCAPPPTP